MSLTGNEELPIFSGSGPLASDASGKRVTSRQIADLAGGGGSGYSPSFVHFPGTAYLGIDPLLATNSKVGVASFNYNDCGLQFGANHQNAVFESGSQENLGGGLGIQFIRQSPGLVVLRLDMADAGDNDTITVYFSIFNWMTGRNNHVLLSWDLTTNPGYAAAFVNGMPAVAQDLTVISPTFVIDYTSSGDPGNTTFFAGGSTFNNPTTKADMADLFLDLSHTIVTSKQTIAPADLAKFWNGGPVSLGADGSTPFGVRPDVFYTGNADSFPTNRGTGGAATLTGVITDV